MSALNHSIVTDSKIISDINSISRIFSCESNLIVNPDFHRS